MDALKAEIAAKRKALEDGSSERPNKYMRRGDVERIKEEQERKEREEKEKAKQAALKVTQANPKVSTSSSS
jgi:pre-mRNA-splicing factor 18